MFAPGKPWPFMTRAAMRLICSPASRPATRAAARVCAVIGHAVATNAADPVRQSLSPGSRDRIARLGYRRFSSSAASQSPQNRFQWAT